MNQKAILTITFILALTLLIPMRPSNAQGLAEKLSGKILLQVEGNGEAWYVYPKNNKKYYLGRPLDAFQIMGKLGLGVSNADLDSFNGYAPKNLSGYILLRVEDNGEAYYVSPDDLKMHYLDRPADAFQIMRELGLGITNSNLSQITIDSIDFEILGEKTLEGDGFSFIYPAKYIADEAGIWDATSYPWHINPPYGCSTCQWPLINFKLEDTLETLEEYIISDNSLPGDTLNEACNLTNCLYQNIKIGDKDFVKITVTNHQTTTIYYTKNNNQIFKFSGSLEAYDILSTLKFE